MSCYVVTDNSIYTIDSMLQLLHMFNSMITCSSMNADRTVIGLGFENGDVGLFDARNTRGLYRIYHDQSSPISSLCLRYNIIVSGSDDGTARVYFLESTSPAYTSPQLPSSITEISILGDGRVLLNTGTGVYIWYPQTDKIELVPVQIDRTIVLANSEIIVKASEELTLWDPEFVESRAFEDQDDVNVFDVSDDGLRMICWKRRSIRLYDLETNELLKSFLEPREPYMIAMNADLNRYAYAVSGAVVSSNFRDSKIFEFALTGNVIGLHGAR
jgi:WD40 repeat protein